MAAKGLVLNTCPPIKKMWRHRILKLFREVAKGARADRPEWLKLLEEIPWCPRIVELMAYDGLKSKKLRELLGGAKWSLWHGNTKLFNERINELIKQASNVKLLKKLRELKQYIANNELKIVDYNTWKDQNLIFTSNLAECTVESLMNQRCKGKQHMQWSREGVQLILQICASSASNDWQLNWEEYILGAYQKAA